MNLIITTNCEFNRFQENKIFILL